ncbi:hypothetical protein KM043_005994 [Ampulex compressa]|nr:hypothetical protein KM043_005994 [Ampulex compressa]
MQELSSNEEDEEGSTVETEVMWKKDSIRLERGTSHSFRKIDPEAHVMVDTFSTLYLTDVSKNEEGNYTCYVGGINMMQLKVIVVSKTRLLTQAFLRHLGYLGFIFLLTSFCYCAGLILACRQRHRFNIVNGEDTVSKPEEQKALME